MRVNFTATERSHGIPWKDVKIGQTVQSRLEPKNFLLKSSEEKGLRLTPMGKGKEFATLQIPGDDSLWFVCLSTLTVTPVEDARV